jgi:hypothetical protein
LSASRFSVRRRVTSRTWPGALLIRIPFDRQAIRLNRALEKHIPKGVTALLNEQQYDPVPRDAYLDVFYPSGIDGIAKAMSTIVLGTRWRLDLGPKGLYPLVPQDPRGARL